MGETETITSAYKIPENHSLVTLGETSFLFEENPDLLADVCRFFYDEWMEPQALTTRPAHEYLKRHVVRILRNEENEIVAMSLTTNPKDKDLGTVIVREDYRQRGIASFMSDIAAEEIINSGADSLVAEAETLEGLNVCTSAKNKFSDRISVEIQVSSDVLQEILEDILSDLGNDNWWELKPHPKFGYFGDNWEISDLQELSDIITPYYLKAKDLQTVTQELTAFGFDLQSSLQANIDV